MKRKESQQRSYHALGKGLAEKPWALAIMWSLTCTTDLNIVAHHVHCFLLKVFPDGKGIPGNIHHLSQQVFSS